MRPGKEGKVTHPYCVPRRHALCSLHLLVDDVSCTVTVEKRAVILGSRDGLQPGWLLSGTHTRSPRGCANVRFDEMLQAFDVLMG